MAGQTDESGDQSTRRGWGKALLTLVKWIGEEENHHGGLKLLVMEAGDFSHEVPLL